MAMTTVLTVAPAPAAPADSGTALLLAFKEGQFDQVVRLYEALPPAPPPARDILRAALQSYLRLGRPEAALPVYRRLVPAGQPDDLPLLRALAWSFVSSHARDQQEYVRIAAFTVMAETADRGALQLLEDGLLDTSLLVRARATEGLGRLAAADRQKTRPAALPGLKRALQDPTPPVRIAAMNALGELGGAVDAGTRSTLVQIARTDEGPAQVFAQAALVKLGNLQALDDILSAATLPNPDLRMAAIGVLGRIKRPSTLSLLTQSIYDPDESVRAFAAGALGDFGNPSAGGALTQALSDESPRVRGVAAVSLGRLGVAQSRPLLQQTARDPVELVRAGAVEGLLRLGDKEAVLLAADLAKHSSPSVRAAAAGALALPGNVKALPVLEGLLADQQPQPRLAAARALGRLGDRRALPLLMKTLGDSDAAIRITAAGSLLQILPPEKRDTR